MVKKNVPFLFVCLLIFSFVAVKVESAELPVRIKGGADYLQWQVQAYKEVEIGEEFSVTFKFLPVGSTLDVVSINVSVSGEGIIFSGDLNSWTLEPDTTNSWITSWTNTSFSPLRMYEKTANLTAVEESNVYGYIEGVYHGGGELHSMYIRFDVAGIHAKTYQDYQQDYQELEIDYNELNQSLLDLQKKYDSLKTNLNNTQTMTYAFMITTVVFIVTTIYFAVRKAKVKTS